MAQMALERYDRSAFLRALANRSLKRSLGSAFCVQLGFVVFITEAGLHEVYGYVG